MYCQNCGAEIPDGAKVCDKCGLPQGRVVFCQHCGTAIDADCVVCPSCGKQVKEVKSEQPQVIINNSNSNVNTNTNVVGGVGLRAKSKWVAFLLCLFLGFFGAHKFYEGKTGMGILYLFTGGLIGLGWLVDIIILLTKPDPYYI